MRNLRRIVVLVIILLLAAQVIPVDRKNPPVDPARDFYNTEKVPPNLRAIFDRSCSDCHSDQTRWPWYSHVAPFSWMVANDVHEARHHVNFSEWANYNAKKRDHEIEEICNQILQGDMPDSKYTLIHRSARLSQDDREAVCKWTGSPH